MNHGVGAFRPPHLINVICKKHGDSHKKYYKMNHWTGALAPSSNKCYMYYLHLKCKKVL